MDAHRVAFNTWQEKTEWVQKDKRFNVLLPWGKHRADVLKEYIDLLESRIEDMAVQIANAESKCREMQAENVTLNDKMNRLATWPGIEFYSSAWEFCNLDGNDALEFMCDVQTPSTDAFLAEVRAQGVEMLAAEYESKIEPYKNHDEFMNAHYLKKQAIEARNFAAQLRKGVQS